MQFKYAAAAWNDIKNSEGWMGKLALLSLVNFIPIFGQIVALGYAYGWARDIAWGMHAPLPAKVFGNEDGKLYSRGFYIMVVAFVITLIPLVLSMFTSAFSLSSVAYNVNFGDWDHSRMNPFGAVVSLPLNLVSMVVYLAAWVCIGVGAMRTAIYDRISAGLQFNKIWAMISHDANGVLRIVAMACVIAIVLGVAASIIGTIVVFLMIGMSFGTIANFDNIDGPFELLVGVAPSLGVGFVMFAALAFVVGMGSAFLLLMVARATGYWTRQFNVAQWRGQDDPMPFEAARAYQATQAQAQAQQYAAQVQYAQAQAEYAHAQGQAINYQHQQAQEQYAQAAPATTAAPAVPADTVAADPTVPAESVTSTSPADPVMPANPVTPADPAAPTDSTPADPAD